MVGFELDCKDYKVLKSVCKSLIFQGLQMQILYKTHLHNKLSNQITQHNFCHCANRVKKCTCSNFTKICKLDKALYS